MSTSPHHESVSGWPYCNACSLSGIVDDRSGCTDGRISTVGAVLWPRFLGSRSGVARLQFTGRLVLGLTDLHTWKSRARGADNHERIWVSLHVNSF